MGVGVIAFAFVDATCHAFVFCGGHRERENEGISVILDSHLQVLNA